MDDDAPNLSYLQQLDARRIEQSAGVVPGSISFAEEDGVEILSFEITTEPTVEPPSADIRDIEAIHFIFRDGRRFGETAPSNVLCARADFPRNIVHLCAGPPGSPAAPCLALGGLQPLYERAGIEAIMVRLRDFLRDAKTGTLTAKGWEPVPFGIDQKLRPGEVNPHFFQELAHAQAAAGQAIGAAINFEIEEGGFVIVFPQVLAPEHMVEGLAFRNQGSNERRGIPWIFLWAEPDKVETDPIFADWRTGRELREGMRRIGVEAAFDAATGDLLQRGIDFKCHRPPLGGKGLVVVLGVWRPEPIMPAFFGYSDDPEARRLELRAFMVSQDILKEIVADDSRVETIVGDYPPSPELFRWVAGVERLPPIAFLGVGALGSAIYNSLIRSGLDDALIYDIDALRPHNLARHTAQIDDLYRAKTAHADRLLRGIVRETAVQIEANEADAAAIEPAELKARLAGRLVIDATADERMRMCMDELRDGTDITIIRTEMFHEGRLGATFVAPPDGPALSDMMLTLIAAASTDSAVAAWLDYEEQHPFGPDPMLYGFGCTSQTVHLPNHVVAQQASVATAAIFSDRTVAGIVLNPLDASFRPTGWRLLPVEPFKELVPPTAPDWTVRISAGAIGRLEAERNQALPQEIGGYLYGSWDPLHRQITVVHATGLPPDSTASATTLELGPAGALAEEKRLTNKTHGRVYLCGTWHSHTNNSARMSGRDHQAMTVHHAQDQGRLSPTLIVIVADGDCQAHLRVPE